MKNATLEQGMKVQKMIVDKGILTEQLQWVFDSGALSDLFDANPADFNRDAFRAFLGLKPLNSPVVSLLPLLIPVGTATVAATTNPFVVRDRIVKNTSKNAPVKISYVGDYFKECFYGKTEEAFGGSTLNYRKLSRSSVDGPIIAELGGEARAETTLTEVYALMEAQKNGENGPLLINGYANIFYVRDAKGVLRTVYVHLDVDGWDVDAHGVTYPSTLNDDYQVFSRNS
jgi:hypothetical protein